MQSETGFPSSHQLKSYVASKSRLKLAARAVLSADAGLLVQLGLHSYRVLSIFLFSFFSIHVIQKSVCITQLPTWSVLLPFITFIVYHCETHKVGDWKCGSWNAAQTKNSWKMPDMKMRETLWGGKYGKSWCRKPDFVKTVGVSVIHVRVLIKYQRRYA